MAQTPLMPKATAVWLVDNTSLTFEQIADFCGLHVLEVKGIADGDVAVGIKGLDPVGNGQLSRDELEKAERDPSHRLMLAEPKTHMPPVERRKGPRYTPVSRRQDRPDAIAWLLRHHPELSDSQVMKLVGTTKPTIESIRERTHWNSANLTPKDPVTLGLCAQSELDEAVKKAAERVARERKKAGLPEPQEPARLLPVEETVQSPESAESVFPEEEFSSAEPSSQEEAEIDADSVFAGLAKLKIDGDEDAKKS